jgi:hypothetical protein
LTSQGYSKGNVAIFAQEELGDGIVSGRVAEVGEERKLATVYKWSGVKFVMAIVTLG